jgi:hypothetical protein
MKRIFLVPVCVLSAAFIATAQNASSVKQAESACGPFDVAFKVKTSASQHPLASPNASVAQVYVIEDWDPSDTGRLNRPTIRVGMDGKWVGADQGDSYVFFPATSGEHHLCVNWKAGLGSANNLVSVYGFNAKPDQTYYFRASMPRELGTSFALILDPLNTDEARLLLARYPNAKSSIKK